MRKITSSLITLAVLMSAPAQAKCLSEKSTVFQCLTSKGKQIEVCDSGKTIDYSFGKPGSAPELAIRAKRDDASTYQWQGMGSAMTYSVDIPNGNTTYSVFWSADRMSEAHAISAGVSVVVSGKSVATVNCAANKPITQQIEGIELKPTE